MSGDTIGEKTDGIDSPVSAHHETAVDQLAPAGEGSGSCGCGASGAGDQSVRVDSRDDTPDVADSPRFIYAIGTIDARFPSVSVEKEFAQALASIDTANLTNREAMHKALSTYRYLAREMCWVLRVEGLESYILLIRDHFDLALLVEALKPGDIATDRDIAVGTRGPLAGPQMCHGLVVPTLIVDQIYSFDIPGFIKSIPRPEGVREGSFRKIAEELFHRIMQMADNVGELAEHRALNYLAVRYPQIYSLATEMSSRDAFLSAVDVRPDKLSATRRIFRVCFSFTNRKTDVTEKYAVRVDVTEKWPFLVNKLQPSYDV